MKIEQQVGGTAEIQDAYTGEPRQLTVDTDNYDLRLHDGTTPGGRLIPNRDNNDERYQAKSAELDGFSFAPAARGLISRIGPGVYRLRVLEVNPLNLEIANANGYGGNPSISLKEEIGTPHHFLDDILIDGVLQVEGGINADLSGDTSGTHNGPVIGNLTGNAAGDHTGSITGDVDVRGSTLLLDDAQIELAKLNGLLAFVVANAVPAGIVVMWSGAVVDIPAGWVLCDGTGGSPVLTDRFIVGAGGGFAVGASGGAATHSHANTLDNSAAHTHALTINGHALTQAELPAHTHLTAKSGSAIGVLTSGNTISQQSAGGGDEEYSLDGVGSTPDVGLTSSVGSGSDHSHTASAADDGVHNHTVNNASASSYPPYYALCYIMRVA